MQKDANASFADLKVDGGASENNLLLQIQADVLNKCVVRPKVTETTAMGVAFFAGLAVGFWKDRQEIKSIWKENARFNPSKDRSQSDQLIDTWKERIKMVLQRDE